MFADPLGLSAEAPTQLTWNEFYEEMDPIRNTLAAKPVNESFPIWDQTFLDSEYYQGSNNNRTYELGGRTYKGSELNYYGIGMLMRREGKGLYQAEVIVTLWKEVNIPGSVLWYLAGQIPADDIYWFPSDNEFYMLRKGYYGYDGPIYEATPSTGTGWDGMDGAFY